MAETTCVVFEPTEAEFGNFRAYIEGIERSYPGIGICKIIPPPNWFVKNYDISKMNFVVKHPLQQKAVGRNGMFSLKLVETTPKTIQKFYEYAQTTEFLNDDFHIRERKFWQDLGHSGYFDNKVGAIYGADVEGTLFTNACTFPQWDLRKLDNNLNGLKPDIPGVSTPMLYIGSWCALFAYHVEDLDLYSINYLHYGAAKSWYSIEPQHRKRLESLAQCYFRQEYEFDCKEFLRHKTKMISPGKLKADGIPYRTVVQNAGEFVVTFPGAYHAGFNHGFNIAEATNFALPRWFDIGRKAGICLCTPDTVRIDVDIIETRYLRDNLRVKQQEQANSYFTLDDHNTPHRIRCLCLARHTFTPTESNPIICDESGRFIFFESFPVNKTGSKTSTHELKCCQTCALWYHTECVQAAFVEQEMKFSCHVCQRIDIEDSPFCSPSSGNNRVRSGGKSGEMKLLLTPPTTIVAGVAKCALSKKRRVQPAAVKATVVTANIKQQQAPPPASNLADLTLSTAAAIPSSSGNNQHSRNQSTCKAVASNTAVGAVTVPRTVLEVGYQRNQLVSILLPRHVKATVGMLVNIEGHLGRLHVKGDPKANDIWVNLNDCYVMDDPPSLSTAAPLKSSKRKKDKDSDNAGTKKRVLGYEASINKALRLSMMDSKATDQSRQEDSMYFDEAEVSGNFSVPGSIPYIPPVEPQQSLSSVHDVKMEAAPVGDVFGSYEDDDQSLHSCGENQHDANTAEEMMMVDAIPVMDLLPTLISPVVMNREFEVIDLIASDDDDDDDEEEDNNSFFDGKISARVADLQRLK